MSLSGFSTMSSKQLRLLLYLKKVNFETKRLLMWGIKKSQEERDFKFSLFVGQRTKRKLIPYLYMLLHHNEKLMYKRSTFLHFHPLFSLFYLPQIFLKLKSLTTPIPLLFINQFSSLGLTCLITNTLVISHLCKLNGGWAKLFGSLMLLTERSPCDIMLHYLTQHGCLSC